MPSPLIEQLLNQRRGWVDLGGGLKVRVCRPAEAEMPRVMSSSPLVVAGECVDGWEGFTAAVLLGPAVGSSDALPFDAELWRAVLADNTAWCEPVVEHVRRAIGDHLAAKEATAKN